MGTICGLACGRPHDHPAMAIAEVQGEHPNRRSAIVHRQRYPLSMKYVAISEAVGQLWHDSRIPRDPPRLVEATGVGRPLCDGLRTLGLRPIDVVVTGGTQATQEDGLDSVPKHELVTTLQLLLGSQRLKIAQARPEAQTLVKELVGYQRKMPAALHAVFGVWREGPYDDLLFAAGLACWDAEYQGVPAYQVSPSEMERIWAEAGVPSPADYALGR
jgi:hypothetical protein